MDIFFSILLVLNLSLNSTDESKIIEIDTNETFQINCTTNPYDEDIDVYLIFDGSFIQNNKSLSYGKGFFLYESKFDKNNIGKYECSCVNRYLNIIKKSITIYPKKNSSSYYEDYNSCSYLYENYYCSNGGKCYQDKFFGIHYCYCKYFFTGSRCEYSSDEYSVDSFKEKSIINPKFVFSFQPLIEKSTRNKKTIAISTILICLFLILFSLIKFIYNINKFKTNICEVYEQYL